jgi:hypothetical protein
MADAAQGGILFDECRPHLVMANEEPRHDRNSCALSIGPQSDAGDRAALVVPQPVSRLARAAPLSGVYRFVIAL